MLREADVKKTKYEEDSMIRAAISFFVLAIVAFIFGAYGIAGISMEIGRILLFVFLVLAAVSFIGALITGRTPRQLP